MWKTDVMATEPLKLAGITMRQAYYDAKYWHELTGINPLDYPQYFTTTKTGLIYCTDKFKADYKRHRQIVASNYNFLGVHTGTY